MVFSYRRSNMIRYKLILFLILLPLLTKSKNVRPKRPFISFEDDASTQLPLLDQLTLADTWKTTNRIISATYSGDPQTGHLNHANLVINVVPRKHIKPAEVDLIASQALHNAKTAEEYVSKALEMKHNYDQTTPSSSFVKYDIYEREQTKLSPILSSPTSQFAEPIGAKDGEDADGDMAKSASEYAQYYHQPEYIQTTTTYKHPSDVDNFNAKDLDEANSDYHQQFTTNFDSIDTIKSINYDNQKSFHRALQKLASYPSKQEMMELIEKAVDKYLQKMDLNGKMMSNGLNSVPNAHAEIMTYYRFPSTTTANPVATTKLYSAGTHSEFFKPTKSSHLNSGSFTTVKPFTLETYTSDGIDLTIRSKKRPKPIDLSALDVGQSYSHSTSSNSDSVPSYRKPHKSKLHLNTQAYHEINALPYVPGRGLMYDDNSPYSTAASYHDYSNAHSSLKDHSVDASFLFAGGSGRSGGSSSHKSYASDDSNKHFTPSMQVINGMPVSNPYKFNMNTLNDIFQNSGERTKYTQMIDNNFGSAVAWNPYNLDLSTLEGNTGSSSSYTFGTYNPKFNNNPDEYGNYHDGSRFSASDWDSDYVHRQRGTIGSDMYASGSSHRTKKVATPHSNSSSSGGSSKRTAPKPKPKPKQKPKQRSSKQRVPQHNRDLHRDLVPPPPAKF